MSATVKPRIIVTICNGVVDVYSDNVDLSHVDLITLDHDTEGAEESDLATIDGRPVYFSVGGVAPADDDMSRDVARAYDNWAVS